MSQIMRWVQSEVKGINDERLIRMSIYFVMHPDDRRVVYDYFNAKSGSAETMVLTSYACTGYDFFINTQQSRAKYRNRN